MNTAGSDRPQKPRSSRPSAESTTLNTWLFQVLATSVTAPLKHVWFNSAFLPFDATRFFEFLCLPQIKRATDRSPEKDCWCNCTYTKINAAGLFDLQIVIVLLFPVPQNIRFFVVTHFLWNSEGKKGWTNHRDWNPFDEICHVVWCRNVVRTN